MAQAINDDRKTTIRVSKSTINKLRQARHEDGLDSFTFENYILFLLEVRKWRGQSTGRGGSGREGREGRE